MPRHHISRTAVALTAAGATTVGLLAMVITGHSAIADPTASSAFGVSATGAVPLPPQPSVSSPDGQPVTESAPVSSPDGSITANATVRASAGQASAIVTNLSLLFGQVNASEVTARCDDGTATVTVSGGSAADAPLPTSPTPGQTIPLGTTGSVELNSQTANADGSITVVGLRTTITTPGGEAETIVVASATCAPQQAPSTTAPETTAPPTVPAPPPSTTPSPPTAVTTTTATGTRALPTGRANRPAPAPTPVRAHIAVTG